MSKYIRACQCSMPCLAAEGKSCRSILSYAHMLKNSSLTVQAFMTTLTSSSASRIAGYRCLLAVLRQQTVQELCAVASRPCIDRWKRQSCQVCAVGIDLRIRLGVVTEKGSHVCVALAGVCVDGCRDHHGCGDQCGEEQKGRACIDMRAIVNGPVTSDSMPYVPLAAEQAIMHLRDQDCSYLGSTAAASPLG